MAIMRWDPFRDLLSLHGEINRLFGQTFGAQPAEAPGTWAPVLDVYETPDKFSVVVEVPGAGPGDVDISVEDNVLTIRGERKFYEGVAEEAFHRVERRFGPYARRITLPQQCDASRIEATITNGLLTIDVPKAEQAKPRRIEVRTS